MQFSETFVYHIKRTVSEGHGGPGEVLGVEEVEGGLALNLGGDVARHSGDPVVSVDDAAIREMAGQVLVLDSLDQTQLRDRPAEKMFSISPVQANVRLCHYPLSPVPHRAHHADKHGHVGPPGVVAHEVHVLVLGAIPAAQGLLLHPDVE